MKKSKLKKKKCSKWSHKVYNILFPTMFICGFFFLNHCVGATLSLTSMKSYDKWLLPCLCHPQPNQLGWKCDDSFLNSPRLPRIASLRGWGLKAGKRRRTVAELYRLRGWETEDCTLAHSEILSPGHCCIITSAQLPMFSSFVWELVSLPFILRSWE